MDSLKSVLHLICLVGFLGESSGTSYIQYSQGTSNIILSAPHGGYLKPGDIPQNRDKGCYSSHDKTCVYSHNCGTKSESCKVTTVTDGKTRQLTELVRDELKELTHEDPYVVINKLKRTKLDPNREKAEGTFGVPAAEAAWTEYHNSIEQAKSEISARGPGILFDIHAHGKAENWTMLGYLIYGSRLESGNFQVEDTSIRSLVESEGSNNFEQILRGGRSLGYYLEVEKYGAVPSPTNRHPGDFKYFSGGYITKRHGSRESGNIDAIQIEVARVNRYANREKFAKSLAKAIYNFVNRNY